MLSFLEFLFSEINHCYVECMEFMLPEKIPKMAPPGSRKKIWEEEVLSLSICLSIYLLTNTNYGPFSRIKWEIYLYKQVCFVRHYLWFMFPLVFLLRQYNTSCETKYFFLSYPRHCDQELIVVIVYYFLIWNKKELNIIISRVINSHMSPMYEDH